MEWGADNVSWYADGYPAAAPWDPPGISWRADPATAAAAGYAWPGLWNSGTSPLRRPTLPGAEPAGAAG